MTLGSLLFHNLLLASVVSSSSCLGKACSCCFKELPEEDIGDMKAIRGSNEANYTQTREKNY